MFLMLYNIQDNDHKSCVCVSLYSDPELCVSASEFSPFLQDVLLHHLFKSSKSDADDFTVQVHHNLVHVSMPTGATFSAWM